MTTPEPTARSAQESARAGSGGQSAAEPDPLDNIPPLDLPGDAPRLHPRRRRFPRRPPSPLRCQSAKSAATQAGPEDRDARRRSERGRAHLGQPPRARARNVRERRAGACPLSRRRPQARRRQPSLDRRARLAGREGLSHFARSSRISEVPPAFITEATKRGLRYVACPSAPRRSIANTSHDLHMKSEQAKPVRFISSTPTAPVPALWYIRAHRHRPRRPASRTTRSRRARSLKSRVLVGRDQICSTLPPARMQLDIGRFSHRGRH